MQCSYRSIPVCDQVCKLRSKVYASLPQRRQSSEEGCKCEKRNEKNRESNVPYETHIGLCISPKQCPLFIEVYKMKLHRKHSEEEMCRRHCQTQPQANRDNAGSRRRGFAGWSCEVASTSELQVAYSNRLRERS